MEQAVEARSNVPYTQLKSAFLYRKQYVPGCSCKLAEYQPPPGAEAPSVAGNAGGWAAQAPTGSTGQPAPPPLPPVQEDPQGGERLPWATEPQ
jgi:hypothetical protein